MAPSDQYEDNDRLYLDDLYIGQRFTSRSHALDEEQIKAFAGQFDPQPFHLDDSAGARYRRVHRLARDARGRQESHLTTSWWVSDVECPSDVLRTTSMLKCSMYDNALVPVALANRLVSLADMPSSEILSKFARDRLRTQAGRFADVFSQPAARARRSARSHSSRDFPTA
jgi:hypothetical protein